MPTADTAIDRLYELLPTIHRLRDHEQGQPLRALLQVIAEQVQLIEDDIGSLYDNWFIETCDNWVVPYLADLIGGAPAGEAGPFGDPRTAEGLGRNRALMSRREVANTLRYRLRKGTLAVLERLARDVAGMPARAVEFQRLLAASVALNSQRLRAGRSVDLRQGRRLGVLGGPFDEAAHLPDLRRMGSSHTPGRFNPPSVGLFVWRLRAYPITHAPASCIEAVGPHCYSFSVLGNDVPLFNRPRADADADAIAGELDVPAPIDRRAFSQSTIVDGQARTRASPDYYGLAVEGGTTVARSLVIWAEDWPPKEADNRKPVARERIVPTDLDRWSYVPRNGELAVDPERGRIVFPPRQLPKRVYVSYHYGFSGDVGGGEYERPLLQRDSATLVRVKGKTELQRALEPWKRQTDEGGELVIAADQPAHAVIEITDSGVYTIPIDLALDARHSLQIRAALRTRPVIRLLDWQADAPDSLTITGREGSRFILDGVMIAGRGVRLTGALESFTVRHSTLVPGWSLEPDCDPQRPAEPSIDVTDSHPCIVVEHSIVGSIQVNNNEVDAEPVPIRISDSVIDATGTDCDSPECEAIGAAGSMIAHAVLRIVRSTIIGRVMSHAIELAENSILLGRVTVARRQIGCMRFCHVPHGSRTPRRFNCQPDLVEARVRQDAPVATAPQVLEAALQAERRRVWPRFGSTRYGTPAYCQLTPDCAEEIARGADDESEMGVFHDLFQPLRLASLRTRLDEFVPAAVDAGVILVN
jgi:hypothetical protein